jgi:hypothetical protein
MSHAPDRITCHHNPSLSAEKPFPSLNSKPLLDQVRQRVFRRLMIRITVSK